MSSNYYDLVFERLQLIDKLAECEEKINSLNRAESYFSEIEDELSQFPGAVQFISEAVEAKDLSSLSRYMSALQDIKLPAINKRLDLLGQEPISDSRLKSEVLSFIRRAFNSYAPDQLSKVFDECNSYQSRINSSNSDISRKKKDLIKKLIIGVLIAAAAGLLIWFIASNPWVLLIPLGIGIIALVLKIKND